MHKIIVAFNLVIIGSLSMLISGCKVGEIKKPVVNVIKSKFTSVSLKHGRLDTQLSVSNPNVFKLPIETVSYKLFLNDKEFISGATKQSMKIPAGGSQRVELPLDIEYKKLLGGLGAIFKSKTIQFRLQGEVDLGLVTVPYQKIGEFKIN